MFKKTIILLITINSLFATGAWMMNGRVHPELKWKTIESEHFNIHYHQGIEDIAKRGASIAEQVRPILMKQVDLDTLPRIDIVFTAEDEIMNGFAMPSNHTVIWVDQNEVAVWTEDEKWLRTVLAHELQHIVFFNVTKSWLPRGMDMLFSGTPGWVVEGLAEYFTERWRPHRYDLSHKAHVLRGTVHKIKDPHNDGFSKTLYWADRFGDSSIVKILNDRNKVGLFFFENAFEKHTGISLKQFQEDWRRHMNTYFYGYRAQKEALEEVGSVYKFPVKKAWGFDYFSDSLKIAFVGQNKKGQGDISLMLTVRDTASENKARLKALKDAKKKEEKPKTIKPIWTTSELDFGRIHSFIDVAPNDSSIAYAKFRFGKNQSLLWDIWTVNLETKKKTRLTSSARASFPQWHPNGKTILFVAHKASISNLFTINSVGDSLIQITHFQEDVQIITPAWSPDGHKIAYAQSGVDGNVDIHILDLKTNEERVITNNPEVDYLPLWHPDGSKISYTSHLGSTPNLHTIDLVNNATIRNTDVGEAVWGRSWSVDKSAITALTLGDVDSVRVVDISPERKVEEITLQTREHYSSWRTKTPDHPLVNIDPYQSVSLSKPKKYGLHRQVRLLQGMLFPDGKSFSSLGVWTDATGRHTLAGTFYTDYDTSATMIQYQNAEHALFRGFWGFNYYQNINYTWRPYDKSRTGLFEVFDGWSFWGKIPFNFGRNLSSSHTLNYGLQFLNRSAMIPVDFEDDTNVFSDNGLPEPESGKEGTMYFRYMWSNKRPHRDNLLLPKNGFGLSVSYYNISEKLWGDFTYNRFSADLYKNVGLGPFALYGRFKSEALTGDNYPSQEFVGITKDANFYLMGGTLPWKENMNLRGWDDNRLGNRAFMGTVEFRSPGIKLNLAQALIFQLSDLSFALISDFGNAWQSGETQEDILVTAGYELRATLRLMKMPLFVIGFGQAQTIDAWKNEVSPSSYFRLTLINPF